MVDVLQTFKTIIYGMRAFNKLLLCMGNGCVFGVKFFVQQLRSSCNYNFKIVQFKWFEVVLRSPWFVTSLRIKRMTLLPYKLFHSFCFHIH